MIINTPVPGETIFEDMPLDIEMVVEPPIDAEVQGRSAKPLIRLRFPRWLSVAMAADLLGAGLQLTRSGGDERHDLYIPRLR